jgi:hypothetical protein
MENAAMASDDRTKSMTPAKDGNTDKKPGSPAMSDYLQAPRKKRKSFVAFGMGPNLDADTISAIQKFFATQYPKLVVLTVKSPDELVKLASRNIVLTLIDDEFAERGETLKAVRTLKEKRSDAPLPTLFLTKDVPSLIASYQGHLPLWHEVDDYLSLAESPRHKLFEKIKSCLENRNQRRARRFKTNIPITFQILDSGEHRFQGEIVDFSLHGAMLAATGNAHRFSTKDQLVIHFPLSQYVHGKADFFRISARVRRVIISGDKAGISWEYLTGEKVGTLTEILTSIVSAGLSRAAASTRQRYSKFLEVPSEADQAKGKDSRKYEY